MMDHLSTKIAEHYSSGTLLSRFREGLRQVASDRDHPAYDDLAGADELHIGGAEGTAAMLDQLEIAPGAHVLDIGAGVGGPARQVAHRCGCRVTGVDLTPEFIETARGLTELIGLGGAVRFLVGSGTELPLEDETVDVALLLHVAMNIEDKDALFAEAARVLRPEGTFAVYEIMTGRDSGPLTFPLPWSTAPETSFVSSPADYLAAAKRAGLTLVAERDRWEYGYNCMREMVERAAAEGPPPIGPHLFMGATAREKLQNLFQDLVAQRIAPVEMIFRKSDR